MRGTLRQLRQAGNDWQRRALHALAPTFLALACAGIAGSAQAQDGKLGAYTGTVTISGTELSAAGNPGKVDFRATVKITLPLTSRSDTSAMAELSDIDKPSASAEITQWDLAGRNASADSDGKITSWTCALAAPTTIPMNGQGTLNVDYRKKTHSMFIALVSLKPIPLRCVNSRSGAYRQTRTVSLFFGTSEPDVLPWKELPFADPARLSAKYRLVPVSQMKGRYAPVEMAWDLQLTR
ncbi:MAG: hypothetical protein IPP91_06145 [Betaproteobacteria bacterium]|nr:hypothetical protein [Betaproteobacteria bacterium]